MAPSSVDTSTAGTTIRIEFKKYGLSPVASTPICAVDHAARHGSSVNICGRSTMLPCSISASGFTEFRSMTASGTRYHSAKTPSTAYSNTRPTTLPRIAPLPKLGVEIRHHDRHDGEQHDHGRARADGHLVTREHVRVHEGGRHLGRAARTTARERDDQVVRLDRHVRQDHDGRE